MRPMILAAALALVLSLTGCVATSLCPLARNDQDRVRDDRLVGTWSQDDVRWTVLPDGASYRVLRDGDRSVAAYRASLIRIGERLFMELGPAPDAEVLQPYAFYLVPVYTLAKVAFVGDSLRLDLLASDVCRADSAAGSGPRLPCVTGYGSKDDVLITAPPESLRGFLAAHAGDERLFTRQMLARVR
jgi:hypothetical protein